MRLGGEMEALRPLASPSVRRLFSAAWRDTAALGLLALATLVFFHPWLLWGQLYYQGDTYLFYYPVASWYAEFARNGVLPLWTPDLFAGYPLFADGEAGMLYPFQILLYRLLPEDLAFGYLRVLHLFIAAAFMYGFLRALRVGAVAGLVGALTFGFGSFLVTQVHHENVIRTAVWLPFILMCLELGFQTRDWARNRWFAAAGLAWGVGALGLHVQPALMSALATALYIALRGLFGPSPSGRTLASLGPALPSTDSEAPPARGPAIFRAASARAGIGVAAACRLGAAIALALVRRTLVAMWALAMVATIGGGIAAVQWLPLYDLATASIRGLSVSYPFATSYSTPPESLISLLFPYFFRGPDGANWAAWSAWEGLLYPGVVGLVLAFIGLLTCRRVQGWYFLILGTAGLMIALASGAPWINLHELLWTLPGFSALRAPGRFTYLVIFAVAGLAALGTDWLVRCRGARVLWTAPLGATIVSGLWVLLLQMEALHAWVATHQEPALQWIQETHAAILPSQQATDRLAAYKGLLNSTQLANPTTFLPVFLLGSTAVLLLVRPAFQRAPGAWGLAMAALVATDLLAFGVSFHPRATLEELFPKTDEYRYLDGLPEGTRVSVVDRVEQLRPNRLLASQTYEVGGYTSLTTQRYASYRNMMGWMDGRALDLIGAEYVVFPRRLVDYANHNGTVFTPRRALVDGPASNPLGQEVFRVPALWTDEVRVIGSLQFAEKIEQGEQVAEVTLRGIHGERVSLPLLAGVHVSDTAWQRADVRRTVRHELAEIAHSQPDIDADGKLYPRHLYGGAIPLSGPVQVRRVEVRSTIRQGVFALHGLGLAQPEGGPIHTVTTIDRLKFREVRRTERSLILRNDAVFPRAFVVYEAVAPRAQLGQSALTYMQRAAFFPSRQVALNRLPPRGFPIQRGGGRPIRGGIGLPEAKVKDIAPDHVRVRADLAEPGYLVLLDAYDPNWQAYVDGSGPKPVYVADGLFRALPLEQGNHRIDFVYRPVSVQVGLFLAGASWALFLAILAVQPLVGLARAAEAALLKGARRRPSRP